MRRVRHPTMTTQTRAHPNAGYQADFEELTRRTAGDPPWLSELRRQAWAVFQDSGFPTATRGNERWKYSPVGPVAAATVRYPFDESPEPVVVERLHHLVPWGLEWTTLVFVDGRFAPHLSFSRIWDPGVAAIPLAHAVRAYSPEVAAALGRNLDLTLDGFHALNTAFTTDGLFFRVPAGIAVASPVHCVFVATGAAAAAVYPRVLVDLGPGAEATLVESYVALHDAPGLTAAVVEATLGEGAKLDHFRLSMDSAQAFHVGMTRVVQSARSVYRATGFARGAVLGRHDLQVRLDGEGAACDLRGLYVTAGRRHMDHHINVEHLKPATRSDQYFKGILAGTSHAVFSGRVLVAREAQGSQARQSDRNLLLSEGCEIDSKPSLEIYADDVECTHGATAGSVADEELFYMRARGLDLDTATRALVRGFASEITGAITLAPLQAYLEAWITGSVPELHLGGNP